MKKSKQLHVGIIAAVLGGRVADDESVIKMHDSPECAVAGFNNACSTLVGMNFLECEPLHQSNRNVYRIFEKGHWPYLICLSIDGNMLVITMTDKAKLVEQLSATL